MTIWCVTELLLDTALVTQLLLDTSRLTCLGNSNLPLQTSAQLHMQRAPDPVGYHLQSETDTVDGSGVIAQCKALAHATPGAYRRAIQ